MKTEQNEYKSFALQEVKSSNDGAGFVEGVANTLYDLDEYGDIAIDYKGVDDLIKDGAVYDQHGATNGKNKGEYTVGNQLATIDDARPQNGGLFVRWQWHTDTPSQNYRAKIQDKIDRQKPVYLSIGYTLAEPARYVYSQNYKSELPNYIPAEKLPAVLAKAQGLQRIRIIVPKSNEITITPRPVNRNSMATLYKSIMGKQIEFTEQGFKSEFLGEEIEDALALSAIDTLYYRLRSALCCICFPSWDEDAGNEDEMAESTNAAGAIEEFCEMAKGVFAKMQELEEENGNAGMTDEMTQEEKAIKETGVIEFKAVWSTKFQNDLPDSSFAFIETGGKKDSEGKTTPRSLRHFPYKDANGKPDAAHVRNALARIPQSNLSDADKAKALKRIRGAAKNVGVKTQESKAIDNQELKAKEQESLEILELEMMDIDSRIAELGILI